jgi:hypothetical protein
MAGLLAIPVEVFMIDSQDLDMFIHECYPNRTDWTSARSEEWEDLSWQFIPVWEQGQPTEIEIEKMNKFKFGAEYRGMTRILLFDLVRRGAIPPGNYLINVML